MSAKDKDKGRKSETMKSLAELGQLLPARTGELAPSPQPAATTLAPALASHTTVVRSLNRAGRAPYNFVPLAKEWRVWKQDGELPKHDVYRAGLLSGEIELEIEALTDFYIRGMWALEKFTEIDRTTGRPRAVKDQSTPFLVEGKLRLPGSSLRGMVRTLVEILCGSPLEPVNNTQLFYRAVAAVPDPGNVSSFEPQAATYKNRIARVKAGYLYSSAIGPWRICPALPGPDGRAAYRYRTQETWKRERIKFTQDGLYARAAAQNDPRAQAGWVVCSGKMQNKRAQWIVPAENPEADAVEIPEDDVDAYKEGGITQMIEQNRFQYTDSTRGLPCFYVEWQGGSGEHHVAFGHTPNFRLPYMTTTARGTPPANRRTGGDSRWDLAQAIFGRVPRVDGDRKIDGNKGRVFFEDAELAPASSGVFEADPAAIVLGAPKPTTYEHYLVQEDEKITAARHWDGDYKSTDKPTPGVVRGHKLYWHRPGAPIRPAEQKQERVATRLQVAHGGARFRASIRYENLDHVELGALLSAISLPEGCAHHLGMGKPLGLGSFRLKVNRLNQISREDRYAAFFDADSGLVTGAGVATVDNYKEEFARWYVGSAEPKPDPVSAMWSQPRLRELRALLEFDGLSKGADWYARTRYLEFGRLTQGMGGLYNEYLHVGYPKQRALQKRRPLPPASQVLSDDPHVPDDPRPPFEGPPLVPNLRSRKTAS